MPRASTLRRLGVILLMLVSVYFVGKHLFIGVAEENKFAIRPFQNVRSKFHVDAERNTLNDDNVNKGNPVLSSDAVLTATSRINKNKSTAAINIVGAPRISSGNALRTGMNPSESNLPKISSGEMGSGDVESVKLGRKVPNCGISHRCHESEIPMSFYTGTDKLDSPSLCVNDHFIFDRDLNGAGRGLNLVIIDAKTHGVVRTGHFDTYEQDSTELVAFLERMSTGEIVALVSFDEASMRLSDLAKDIFYELGSSLIYKLKFRASWYFVGQKGIDGFSAFEDLTMPPAGSDWAKAINKKVCVPSNLSGRQTLSGQSPDRTQKPRQNSARRHFCARFDGYEDFCSDDRIDQLITARTLSDPKRASHEIFSIPILIVAGLNMNNVRICLESLMNQEGVNRDNILVTYNSDYSEVNELANLFGVRSTAINTTSSYNELLSKSIAQISDFIPSSLYCIVIEEDSKLSPDFLYFIDQLLPTFSSDSFSDVILTFNHNGFVTSSSIPSAVYRVEHVKFHGAYLLKRNAIEKCILAKESTCSRKAAVSGECVCNGYMPDVSRMQWIATDNELNNPLLYSFVHNTIDVIGDNMNGNESVTDSVEDAQSTDQQPARLFTTKSNETLLSTERLLPEFYDVDLRMSIGASRYVPLEDIVKICRADLLWRYARHNDSNSYDDGKGVGDNTTVMDPESPLSVLIESLPKNQSFSIIYEADVNDSNDSDSGNGNNDNHIETIHNGDNMELLSKCFHIVLDDSEKYSFYSAYKGVTRFSIDARRIFLIKSTSAFANISKTVKRSAYSSSFHQKLLSDSSESNFTSLRLLKL